MISSVTKNYFLACLIFYCLNFGELKIAQSPWPRVFVGMAAFV